MRPVEPNQPPNGKPSPLGQIELILNGISTTNQPAQEITRTLKNLSGGLRSGKSLTPVLIGQINGRLSELKSTKPYTQALKQAWALMQALSTANQARKAAATQPIEPSYDVASIHATDQESELKARVAHIAEQTHKAIERVNPQLPIKLKAAQTEAERQSLRQLAGILAKEKIELRKLMRADMSVEDPNSLEILMHRKIVWNRYIGDCIEMSLNRVVTAEDAANIVFNLEVADRLLAGSLTQQGFDKNNFLTMAMPVKEMIISRSCPKPEDRCSQPELEVLECMRDSGLMLRSCHVITTGQRVAQLQIDSQSVVTQTLSPADIKELGIGFISPNAKDSPYEKAIRFRLEWLEVLEARHREEPALTAFLKAYMEYNRSYMTQLQRFREGYQFLASDTKKVFAALDKLPQFFRLYIFMTNSWILPTISTTITSEKPRSQVEFN